MQDIDEAEITDEQFELMQMEWWETCQEEILTWNS